MRILLASESYLPHLSGVTVSVDSLARGLGGRGHEVLVLAPRPAVGSKPAAVGSPGPEPRYAWLGSYQLPAIAPPGYRMPWPNPWSDGLRQARDFRPDVIHAHSPFLTGLAALRLARELGVPMAFTHHTRFADYGHYLGPLAGPASSLTDAYLRRFWRSCAAIVSPSNDLAREIRARLPARLADRVTVIPTGIDVAGIRALDPIDPRVEAGWPEGSLVVASLGRLAPEKSPLLLLEAIALAARDGPDLRLFVIGGGPSAAALAGRAGRADLSGRVHMAGALPRNLALARLRGADLFAFTSRTETQGLVLAEALAAGLPAVAVEGPGVGESVRDGIDGTVVAHEPVASLPERLAQAIVDAAEPARRASLTERALADADRFGIDRRLSEVEALYAGIQAH
jgi:1,2-diacylglycerol 3-alpha-glucosyltransferase